MFGFGRRFMRSGDFLKYAAEFGLIDILPPRTDLLEFLERERLLVPACQVRFPEGIARRFLNETQPHYADPSLDVEPDGPRLEAAVRLANRLPLNDGMGLAEPSFHPFDLVHPAQAEFIEHNVGRSPFRPWRDQRVLVGRDLLGKPYYDERNPEHFYHYWQALVLAEVLATRVSVLSTDNAPLSELLPPRQKETSVRDLLKRAIVSCFRRRRSSSAPRTERPFFWTDPFRSDGWRELPAHVDALDAIGMFVAYRSHYLFQATKDQGATFRLEGEKLAEFRRMERSCALFALRWRGVDPDALLDCLEWHAARWRMWSRYGPARLVDEYKTNAIQTIYLYRLATGDDYDQMVAKLTPQARALIDAMLPNWVEQQKALATRSLTRWILPKLSFATPVGLAPAEANCAAFVDWLSASGRLQFFLLLEGFGERLELDVRVRLPALAKTVEGLASTLEHMLNDLGAPPGMLKSKTMWFWSNQADILGDLQSNWSLTDTRKGSFAAQQAAIRALSGGKPCDPVVRVLLEGGLIRNQGTHGAFPGFDEDSLTESMEILLEQALLIWMNASMRGII